MITNNESRKTVKVKLANDLFYFNNVYHFVLARTDAALRRIFKDGYKPYFEVIFNSKAKNAETIVIHSADKYSGSVTERIGGLSLYFVIVYKDIDIIVCKDSFIEVTDILTRDIEALDNIFADDIEEPIEVKVVIKYKKDLVK